MEPKTSTQLGEPKQGLVQDFEEDAGADVDEGRESRSSAADLNEIDSPSIWWATWRSVVKKDGSAKLNDIAEGLETFDRYKLTKVSDYASQPAASRPTLSTWINIYQGRIGLETYAIYLGVQNRWITVSGRHILDLYKKRDPMPVSQMQKDRAKIDAVYRVDKKQSLNYSAGYKDGYELGMSECWIKARDTARKEIWTEAFSRGKQEARLETEQGVKRLTVRNIALACFSLGAALTAVVSYVTLIA